MADYNLNLEGVYNLAVKNKTSLTDIFTNKYLMYDDKSSKYKTYRSIFSVKGMNRIISIYKTKPFSFFNYFKNLASKMESAVQHINDASKLLPQRKVKNVQLTKGWVTVAHVDIDKLKIALDATNISSSTNRSANDKSIKPQNVNTKTHIKSTDHELEKFYIYNEYNQVDSKKTDKMKIMLSDLVKDGSMWIATAEDVEKYNDNFHDIWGNYIGDLLLNNQLVAFKDSDVVYLFNLESLYDSLVSDYGKYDISIGKYDTTKTLICLSKTGKAINASGVNIINQGMCPPGIMDITHLQKEVMNHDCKGQYVISYTIEGGIQKYIHPNPGIRYSGTVRKCYMPDNEAGSIALLKLIRAWEYGHCFSVGTSITTKRHNQTIWKIHHKTDDFGHRLEEDPMYTEKLSSELYDLNITDDTLKDMTLTTTRRNVDTRYNLEVLISPDVFKHLQKTLDDFKKKN